jgi:hypothetical protein
MKPNNRQGLLVQRGRMRPAEHCCQDGEQHDVNRRWKGLPITGGC